jgi:hypothetical protein
MTQLFIMDADIDDIKFVDLEEKERISLCTNPHAVSVTKNPDDETFEQIEKMQERYLMLPLDVREKIISSETEGVVFKIGTFFKLQLLQMANIARLIRSYYFGEIKLEDFPGILSREIPVDINTAQNISKQIIEKIIQNNLIGVNKTLTNIPLSNALKQFPNLGEQLISSSGIKMKYFNTPVRPSIKNWIADYNEVVGVENHDMMKRGDYLFHGENGQKLTTGERQKVAEILKSYDENSMLSVDAGRQEVVFTPVTNEVKIENKPENKPAINKSRLPVLNRQPIVSRSQTPIVNQQPVVRPQSAAPAEKPMSFGNLMNERTHKNFATDARPTFSAIKPEAKNIFTGPINKPSVNGRPPVVNNQTPTIPTRPAVSVQPPVVKKPNMDGMPSVANQTKENKPSAQFFRGPNGINQRNGISSNEKPNENQSIVQQQGSISFSSPHKFPAENTNKNNNSPKNIPQNIPPQDVPQPSNITRRNPYIINPHPNLSNFDEPKIQGNVVDLKN